MNIIDTSVDEDMSSEMSKSKDMPSVNKAWERGGRNNKQGGNTIQGREERPKKKRTEKAMSISWIR